MYIVYRTFQVSPAVGGRIVPGSAVGSGTGASLVVTSCVVGADATTLTPVPVLAPVLELGTRLPSAGVRKENTNWKNQSEQTLQILRPISLHEDMQWELTYQS